MRTKRIYNLSTVTISGRHTTGTNVLHGVFWWVVEIVLAPVVSSGLPCREVRWISFHMKPMYLTQVSYPDQPSYEQALSQHTFSSFVDNTWRSKSFRIPSFHVKYVICVRVQFGGTPRGHSPWYQRTWHLHDFRIGILAKCDDFVASYQAICFFFFWRLPCYFNRGGVEGGDKDISWRCGWRCTRKRIKELDRFHQRYVTSRLFSQLILV